MAQNLDMCPDRGLNQQPLGWQAGTPSPEPHQPRLSTFSLAASETSLGSLPPCRSGAWQVLQLLPQVLEARRRQANVGKFRMACGGVGGVRVDKQPRLSWGRKQYPGSQPQTTQTSALKTRPFRPWLGRSGGLSIFPHTGHTQASTNGCINQWNSRSMFLSLSKKKNQ